jgi:hypothetical protein
VCDILQGNKQKHKPEKPQELPPVESNWKLVKNNYIQLNILLYIIINT